MAETKFSVMVSLFNWMQKSKSPSSKRSKFRKFLDTFCRPNDGGDYFSAIRLILPALDRERGTYGFREHVLATCLIDAIGMSRDSPDAQRLLKWRKGGPRSGAFAGNFSLIAAEVLQRRQAMTSGGLTIRQLNDLLDRLASSENRSDKTSVLSELIRKTNAQEMKWIIMIILKDLKLGLSEKSIFREFHPDAEDLFNVTCDLKLVCEKLRNRGQRHKRQDIEVGKPVRPQLALRVSNVAAAWKKLHGKEVVAECKFDGDRIQIHKNGALVNFFSRNFLDHPEYEPGMSDVIRENILVHRCILDGEMLVWDKSANRFADFGSNQEIAKAAKEGLDSDRQLCYVAFDILYVGDTSVIHQSLKERHQLLKNVIKPVAGRLEILVPDGGLNLHRLAGESCCSQLVHDADSVEKFFKETVENRDEGIVLKDLNSKWEPSDRSGKWLKLKPDYVRAGSDLDVLIIGGYYGSGRHGGEVAQFLVGLAERPAPNTYPRRFVSFCRVGTGLSDEELKAVNSKLKPYFRKYEYPKKSAPSFYQVTNNSKERPDVWVESPEKSIIVSITSDIRTIRSEVFAAPYSLRFPRIDQVRHDKPWYECLDVQSFIEMVHSTNGTTQQAGTSMIQKDEPRHVKGVKRKNVSLPDQFVQTDVSQVKGETSIFSKMTFYFANVPSSISLDSLHKMVVENGGSFSMNLNNSVTHCIASESKGIKFQAAKRQGDVISISWFSDSCTQKELLPLLPKYFLHLSDASRKKLEEEIDEFSDSYFLDINAAELKQILGNIGKSPDSKAVEIYKKKLCPREEWRRFHGYHIYFYLPREQYLKNKSSEILLEFTMRRMKNEIYIHGGSVSDMPSHATHLVVVSGSQTDVDFNTLLIGLPEADRWILRHKQLEVVRSQWLEDCFEKDQIVPESNYILKPPGFEYSLTGDGSEEEAFVEQQNRREMGFVTTDKGEEHDVTISEKPRLVTLPDRRGKSGKRKGSVMTGETMEKQVVDKRPRMMPRGSLDDKKEMGTKTSGLIQLKSRKPQIRRSKPAKIGGNDDDYNEEKTKGKVKETKDDENRVENHAKISENDAFREEQTTKDGSHDMPVKESNETELREGCSKSQYESTISRDPIEAMLLSMVPALNEKKGESEIPVVSSEIKGPDVSNEGGKSCLDGDVMPVKKKKVSYKDVANQLLKDW